ncbi:enoyl-CoA hydratase/isomerase family protein [Natronomonas gomsonensis]|jgi:2-(1,2-epoxy-1,2-dihydrophenyl)acetyl-CoA isomerase|uniref:enoyl-CoA hydratase/isomerase family protein n=1 Tax=Natronomonas gomsonensis TaxID=1046043 RepID=UPI0020CA8D61|nr:enoyl-CoA hydratase-related protein [Natronomonas gomsonensis]MCY4730405.1 enoyl-CoA hydratase/isomerase family protein [Natronomonas gomsonensis]
MSQYDTIEVTRDGSVGRVAFDRPDAHNSLNETMGEELAAAAHDLVSDDSVRCITLTGNGPVFNTGADLTMLSGDETDEPTLRRLTNLLHEFVAQLIRAPKPVVTGINGVTAGGGLGPAICGDIVLIAESARLEFAYPRIALSGDGGSTYLLPRLVGMRTAQEIAFRDEPIGAEEAVDIGLATEVVGDDEFEARLTEEAERLAAGPTKSYAATKGLLRKSFDNSLNEQLAEEGDTIAGLTDSEDFSRGHAAFNSDEEPDFTGE